MKHPTTDLYRTYSATGFILKGIQPYQATATLETPTEETRFERAARKRREDRAAMRNFSHTLVNAR